jgi:hypothetical protein
MSEREQSVVRVVVTVTEDGVVVGEHDIGYFAKQPYKVEISTPDGVDYVVADREAASPSSDGAA